MPHPASGSTGEDTSPSVTGRMNASSRDVVAPASTELTTAENRTANPTTAIESTDSQTVPATSAPTTTSTAPATASPTCACSRRRIVPEKSTSSSIANEPKAAKTATTGSSTISLPIANAAGMATAVRAARRSAIRPRSCLRSQSSGCRRRPPMARSSPPGSRAA
jgi:hypothetical protein